MKKTINQTANGIVFRCSTCNKIHIEFKNLNFNFNDKEYETFADCIATLNGEEVEYKNQKSNYKRKIVLHVSHRNLNILLNKRELEELKQLFNKKCKPKDNYTITGVKLSTINKFLN